VMTVRPAYVKTSVGPPTRVAKITSPSWHAEGAG
jgi:hypothetical protein